MFVLSTIGLIVAVLIVVIKELPSLIRMHFEHKRLNEKTEAYLEETREERIAYWTRMIETEKELGLRK